MTDFLVGGSAWWALPAVMLMFGAVFGFFPGFLLRPFILLYPLVWSGDAIVGTASVQTTRRTRSPRHGRWTSRRTSRRA